jgi:hypothetical protein
MIMVEAEAAGANCCLQKPISIDLLWSAIDRVLGTAANGEAPAPGDRLEDQGRALAGDVDSLVERLRRCTTKEEKEEVLKQLKESIRELQSRERENTTEHSYARHNSTQT